MENENLETQSFDKDEYKDSIDKAFDKELAEINEQLDKEILFALVGDVNVGKSSTINQLMGEDVADVGGNPGETTTIAEYKYKGKDKIVFVDTPGLNDINQQNSQKTLEYYKRADVILFMLNSAGTVFSDVEKKCFLEIIKVNKNVVVVLNKIDASDKSTVLRQIAFVKDQIGGTFSVVPISSRTGDNVEKLRDVVLDVLRVRGKEILFAKFLKDKSAVAKKWILAAGTSAGAVGLAPIPGSDIVPITSIQVGLLLKLATLYEKPLTKEAAKELVMSAIVGSVGKGIFRQLVKLVPVAGPIIAGGVGGGMTVALGFAVNYAYENNIDLDATQLKTLYQQFLKNEHKE